MRVLIKYSNPILQPLIQGFSHCLPVFILLTCITLNSGAQDKIFTNDNNIVKATEITIGESIITYKLHENPDRGLQTLGIDKIVMIRFEDGSIRTFGELDDAQSLLEGTSGHSELDSLRFRNQVVELSYTLIPESMTHGADIHIDFVSIPMKSDKIWRIPIGFGGGYAKQTYSDRQFEGLLADIEMQRIYGHFTLGFRLNHRHGGLTLRGGYNFMMGIYDYLLKVPEPITFEEFEPSNTKYFHRIHTEAVAFKSFTRKKPGVGIFGGIQYLINPLGEGDNLFLVKTGLAF